MGETCDLKGSRLICVWERRMCVSTCGRRHRADLGSSSYKRLYIEKGFLLAVEVMRSYAKGDVQIFTLDVPSGDTATTD